MFDHLLLKPEGPTDLLRVSVWLPVAVSLCWAGLLPPTDAPGAWPQCGGAATVGRGMWQLCTTSRAVNDPKFHGARRTALLGTQMQAKLPSGSFKDFW